MRTFAVFDIGSNTVLVTVGRLRPEGGIETLWDEGEVVRMSEGLQDGGILQPEAKQRVLAVLEKFHRAARQHGATETFAAGTAAFRRARDGEDFAREIFDRLGVPVRILSGDEEARYSFASAKLDFGSDAEALGMIDIGGGSTEFVFGERGPRFSLPLGTVRMSEAWIHGHPIPDADWTKLLVEIGAALAQGLVSTETPPLRWAAVAATPASLAAVLLRLPKYQPEKIHGFSLRKDDLATLLEKLRNLDLTERRRMPGMHPDRAELLPIGGAILWRAMEFLKLDEVLVSDHGLRYGLLHEELTARRS